MKYDATLTDLTECSLWQISDIALPGKVAVPNPEAEGDSPQRRRGREGGNGMKVRSRKWIVLRKPRHE